MRLRKVARAVTLGLASGLALAGCAGDTENSGAGGDATNEIVIGNVGSYTGPQSSQLSASRPVIEAWVAELNAAGGLGGRPVRLVVKDDGSNATNSLNAVRELVEEEQVEAVVANMSLFDSAWSDYISSTDVPVIGGLPFTTPFFKNGDFFPSGTNAVARTYGELFAAQEVGPVFGSLYCAEAPACKTGADIFLAFAPELGMTVPVAQSVSASAPNFTAQCQALIDAGVDSYHTAHASEITVRIQDACFAQGLTAPQVATGGIANGEWLTHESTQGTINVELVFPYFDSSTPATKGYQDFLARHGLTAETAGTQSPYAYTALKLFEKAVLGVGAEAVTSEALRTALFAMQGETLEGLAPPLTFNPDGPSLINCWFLATIEDGKWTTPQGLETDCAPDDLVARVAASVG